MMPAASNSINLSARIFVAIFSPPFKKSPYVFLPLNIISLTISNDHLSPKISKAVLIGQLERKSIFFFFTEQSYNNHLQITSEIIYLCPETEKQSNNLNKSQHEKCNQLV